MSFASGVSYFDENVETIIKRKCLHEIVTFLFPSYTFNMMKILKKKFNKILHP